MSFPIRVLAAVTLTVLTQLVGAEVPTKTFVQDRFAIGLWVAPEAGPGIEARYKELADAGFNLVIGTSGANVVEQLALCNRLGLKAIPNSAGPDAPWLDDPACWGTLLTDEPNASAFPELAKQAAAIREKHPGRFGYINLFPTYATPEQLGNPTYDEHLAKFVAQVKPEVLSMDHYPLMSPTADGRNGYCQNLEFMRLHSVSAKIPFWNYFQAMPFANHPDPTEAQLRWQVFTSVAYGAKGVLYFCYWTPGKGAGGEGEFPKGGAIITAEGRRTRHYDEARRINAELRQFGPVLMNCTGTGVRRFATTNHVAPPADGFPLRSVASVGTDAPSEFVVGALSHQDGRRAVMVVNHSLAHTAWVTVDFGIPASEVLEVDKTTGRIEPVVDDSPELKGFQLSFGAGDGRLFVLPAAK